MVISVVSTVTSLTSLAAYWKLNWNDEGHMFKINITIAANQESIGQIFLRNR